MADLKRYNELKERVEDAQKKSDRAQGNLDQIMKQLKNDFDCDDLDEAKDMLEKLEKELKKTEGEFDKAVLEFEKKWGDKL